MNDVTWLMIDGAVIVVLVALNWVLPRNFGRLGLFGVHVLAVITSFTLGSIGVAMGCSYDGALDGIGWVLQAFLFNAATLPLSLKAIRKWQCQHRMPEAPDAAERGAGSQGEDKDVLLFW